MPNLTILSREVRSIDNLFSLNDLHKAAGGQQNHKPIQFLRNQQTQELIEEIEQSSNSCFGDDQSANSHFAVKTKRGGNNAGTWVCKELVYSYAMWISAKFHLQVIRAFDQMLTQQPQQSQLLDYQPERNVTISDLIYEIAQLRGVSTEQVRIHYSNVFNSQDWTKENEFIAAAARTVLRRDMLTELENTSPDMRHLLAMAKLKGLRLVNESDYQSFQARLELQQQEIEKLIDEMMRVSRNHRSLSVHGLWG
ncbi:KilA-N domain-containing protein [Vibrio europaeus]|uniref:KilA-N domain-containing protein n=1 Tax=Vibrio europaeus TaxID=300876 RepID=UPI00233E792E|nr:KilA-N domain-containing protein [Vibrio europaeus]MDC5720624.1 KilA-N domain-containing protein [Vibrio europaeus]